MKDSTPMTEERYKVLEEVNERLNNLPSFYDLCDQDVKDRADRFIKKIKTGELRPRKEKMICLG